MKKKQNANSRIFKSEILESFSKTSPYLTLAFYIPLIFIMIMVSHFYLRIVFSEILIAVFFGIVCWTLVEYLIHRYLFHLPGNSAFSKRFSFILHGIHHQFPRDPARLFMPPLPGLIIIMLLLFIFSIPFSVFSFPFVAGLINGYLIYAFLHFSMHTRKPPKLLKKLWTHHALHHYKDEKSAFGVSTIFWDKLFSTMPVKKGSEISDLPLQKNESVNEKINLLK